MAGGMESAMGSSPATTWMDLKRCEFPVLAPPLNVKIMYAYVVL